VLAEARGRTPLAMLLGQFRDFMILVLLAAAVISGLIGEAKDTVAIIAIVALNAVIGFVQEYRAERALEALRPWPPPMRLCSVRGISAQCQPRSWCRGILS